MPGMDPISLGLQGAGMVTGFLGARHAAKKAQEAANWQIGYGDVAAKDVEGGAKQAEDQYGWQRNLFSNLYGQQQQGAAEYNARTSGNLQPWMDAGNVALKNLTGDVNSGTGVAEQWNKSFDPSSVQMDPGYAWRAQQGEQALQRSASAHGGALGGGSLKALARYSQGVASQEYQNAYGRSRDQYDLAYNTFRGNQAQRMNTLMPLAQFGAQATGEQNQAALNYANMGNQLAEWYGGQQGNVTGALADNANRRSENLANIRLGQGSAKAAGLVGAGNAYSQAMGQIGNNLSQYGMLRQYGRTTQGQDWSKVPVVNHD